MYVIVVSILYQSEQRSSGLSIRVRGRRGTEGLLWSPDRRWIFQYEKLKRVVCMGVNDEQNHLWSVEEPFGVQRNPKSSPESSLESPKMLLSILLHPR